MFDNEGLRTETRDNDRNSTLWVLALRYTKLDLRSDVRRHFMILDRDFFERKDLAGQGISSIKLIRSMFSLAYFSVISHFNCVRNGYTDLQIERRAFQSGCFARAACGTRRIEDYGCGVRVRPTFILSLKSRLVTTGGIDTYYLDLVRLDTLDRCRGLGNFADSIKRCGYAASLLLDIATITTYSSVRFCDLVRFDYYNFLCGTGHFYEVMLYYTVRRFDNFTMFLSVFRIRCLR